MGTEDQHKSRLAEQEQNDKLKAEAADKEKKEKEKAEAERKAKLAEEVRNLEMAAKLEKEQKELRRKQEERVQKEADNDRQTMTRSTGSDRAIRSSSRCRRSCYYSCHCRYRHSTIS